MGSWSVAGANNSKIVWYDPEQNSLGNDTIAVCPYHAEMYLLCYSSHTLKVCVLKSNTPLFLLFWGQNDPLKETFQKLASTYCTLFDSCVSVKFVEINEMEFTKTMLGMYLTGKERFSDSFDAASQRRGSSSAENSTWSLFHDLPSTTLRPNCPL